MTAMGDDERRKPATGAAAGALDPTGNFCAATSEDRTTGRPHSETVAQIDSPGGPAGSAVPEARRYFGNYRLLAEVARGGMGVVYQAEQLGLNRLVAVKMILAGHLATEADVRRFRTEAEAAANLHHPHIVAIHEVGEFDGQHYFSMDYIEGRSLADVVRDHPLPAVQAAGYVKTLAEAVEYAHRQGTLHRDLKPSNVIIDAADQPRITDFGLAKRIGAGAELTATGEILGTPSYMSPEQAGSNRGEIGPATDIYALGAILYELVTGRPPFRAETRLDTIFEVRESQPAAPQLLNPKVPSDLQTICLKCLEKEPQRRYPTAADLADDLGRFLAGDEITARNADMLSRVTRALARSPHDQEFRNWGWALVLFASIIFVAHLMTYLLVERRQPSWVSYGLPRAGMFLLLGAILWYCRPQSIWPTNAAERLIWAVWIGYLAAYSAATGTFFVAGRDHLETYAASAVLSGLGFFVMGSHVWGWCYFMGLVFMAAAPLLALHPDSSPLWFGSLWGLALLTLGSRYLWIARSGARDV